MEDGFEVSFSVHNKPPTMGRIEPATKHSRKDHTTTERLSPEKRIREASKTMWNDRNEVILKS